MCAAAINSHIPFGRSATGGAWGSGPGWGDPAMIPAGHTDLVLPAIGEEWGFVGVLTIAMLFMFLVHRAFRIALNAVDEYAMFLALGLGSLIALEMLLISGGVLGAIPLSGVVSPFLSSGNTAMLANFLIFALILGISNRAAGETIAQPFNETGSYGGCASWRHVRWSWSGKQPTTRSSTTQTILPATQRFSKKTASNVHSTIRV